MQKPNRLVLVLSCAAFIGACGATDEGSRTTTEGNAVPQTARPTCRPAGMDGLNALERFAPPPGCFFNAGGTIELPRVISTAEEFQAALSCQGTPPPAIDFQAHELHVISTMMSPAYAGHEVLDDGTALTLVFRQRGSCPSDPMPMPAPLTIAYLAPHGAARTHQQAVCNVPRECP